MYLCICNPFTEDEAAMRLCALSETTRVKDLYQACSGGESMNCGQCECMLKKMVETHNSTITVGRISAQIEKIVHKTRETVA